MQLAILPSFIILLWPHNSTIRVSAKSSTETAFRLSLYPGPFPFNHPRLSFVNLCLSRLCPVLYPRMYSACDRSAVNLNFKQKYNNNIIISTDGKKRPWRVKRNTTSSAHRVETIKIKCFSVRYRFLHGPNSQNNINICLPGRLDLILAHNQQVSSSGLAQSVNKLLYIVKRRSFFYIFALVAKPYNFFSIPDISIFTTNVYPTPDPIFNFFPKMSG